MYKNMITKRDNFYKIHSYIDALGVDAKNGWVQSRYNKDIVLWSLGCVKVLVVV